MNFAENPLVAFLATRDADRARAFYESKLGLRVVADTPVALVLQSGPVTVRIQKVGEFTPHPFTALGWSVADMARTVADLAARGVTLERYDFVPPDAGGVWTSPDGTRVAWFKDPDGNTLSVTQLPGAPPQ